LRPPAAQQAGFSLGAVIGAPVRDVEVLRTADGWYPVIDSSGATREGTWGRRNSPNWWICRNGRPAPG